MYNTFKDSYNRFEAIHSKNISTKGFDDWNNSMLPRKLQNRENSQSMQRANKEYSRKNKGIFTVLWVLFVIVNVFSN